LFSNESLEFLPINQYISLIFKSICLRFFFKRYFQVDDKLISE
jgi:hypothetical protein